MKTMNELLEIAIELAVKKHKGQVDKGGHPYILHPLAVMNRLEWIEDKIVGVLHDVVEDTDVTFDDLRAMGFPENIVLGVDSVTRRGNESRSAFIERAKQNKIGINVKIADISENINLKRIPNPTEKDFKRVEMYKRELKRLMGEKELLL